MKYFSRLPIQRTLDCLGTASNTPRRAEMPRPASPAAWLVIPIAAPVHSGHRRARLRHWRDPLMETQQIAVPAGLRFRNDLCPIRTVYSNTPQVNILTSDYLHVIIGYGYDPAVCHSASICVANCTTDASPVLKKRANRAPELQQIHQLTNASFCKPPGIIHMQTARGV